MAWLRLDDKFAEHSKLLELGTRTTRWTWVELLLYCARQGKRGHIPRGIRDVLKDVTPEFLERAKSVGLVDERDGNLWIHDFEMYNGTTLDERVQAYLEDHPGATANDVVRAIGGQKQRVLGSIKRYERFQSGSTTVPEQFPSGSENDATGSQVVPAGNQLSGSPTGSTRADPSPSFLTPQTPLTGKSNIKGRKAKPVCHVCGVEHTTEQKLADHLRNVHFDDLDEVKPTTTTNDDIPF